MNRKREWALPGRLRARLARRDPWPVWLLLQMTLCWLLLHAISGDSFFGPSYYNTYTLQALAWRDGRCFLSQDYPALELAIYQGNYYVSFPPLPSLALLPLTVLFGADTPDNLLVKLYAAGACLRFTMRSSARAMPGREARRSPFFSALAPPCCP